MFVPAPAYRAQSILSRAVADSGCFRPLDSGAASCRPRLVRHCADKKSRRLSRRSSAILISSPKSSGVRGKSGLGVADMEGALKMGEIHRFGKMGREASGERASDVVIHAVTAQGYAAQSVGIAQLFHQLHSGTVG